jgi:prepilin signal peptidase PulO-like enzyme (type II secretory pathway)
MITILTIIFLFFGLIIGSFLNVVIFRFNTHRTFGGHSGCMTCKKRLKPHELVPVFSFLFLRGRCSGCKSKISWQYPIVEMISGIIFAFLFLKFQNLFFVDTISFSVTYAFYATVFSILLIIAVYDLRHKIIPDSLSATLAILAFLSLFLFSPFGLYLHLPSWGNLLAGPLVALPFALLWLFSKGTWMGLGDAKLAIGLGWILGISKLLSGIVLSFWLGALVGLFLIFFNKKYSLKSEVPFGPFLVLGTLIAFLFELNLWAFPF